MELGAGMTLRPERNPFTRTLVRWQSFFPAGRVEADNGVARAARISVRTEVGAVLARDSAEIPVTQLFLTGGDTTVRGYSYRSIGARTQNNQLYGGRYMGVASVEWQRPITYRGNMTDWENTLFVDAGAVADRAGDLDPRVGVGTGVRWRSPWGRCRPTWPGACNPNNCGCTCAWGSLSDANVQRAHWPRVARPAPPSLRHCRTATAPPQCAALAGVGGLHCSWPLRSQAQGCGGGLARPLHWPRCCSGQRSGCPPGKACKAAM